MNIFLIVGIIVVLLVYATVAVLFVQEMIDGRRRDQALRASYEEQRLKSFYQQPDASGHYRCKVRKWLIIDTESKECLERILRSRMTLNVSEGVVVMDLKPDARAARRKR